MNRIVRFLVGAIAAAAVALALAFGDPAGDPLRALPSYLAMSAVCGLLIALSWRYVSGEGAWRGLALAAAVGLALRLGLGVFLIRALPVYGYDERPQRAGYVFFDAYKRDTDAWMLAASEKSLVDIARRPSVTDQYGGLMFTSVVIYRLLSPGVHRPLLVVELAAAASTLAVLFTWGFARSLFGEQAGKIAAWAVALYPEAVLLASSQMREPFVGAAFALAFYGYSRARAGQARAGLTAVGLSLLLCLPISPPYTVAVLAAVTGAWAWEGRLRLKRGWLLAVAAVAVAAVALALAARAWSQIGGISGSGLQALLGWWVSAGEHWRLTLTMQESGMLQNLLQSLPPWAHIPLVTAYGLTLPLLPAAVAEPGAPLWRGIAIGRSLGWFVLLPCLVYPLLAIVRGRRWREMSSYLVVLVWATAVLASYRASSPQWDNPRYRAVFLFAQATLVGWAWVHSRAVHSPWLRRVAVLQVGATLLVGWWYAGRYWGWFNPGLRPTLAAVVVFAVLFLGAALALDARRRRLTRPGRGV